MSKILNGKLVALSINEDSQKKIIFLKERNIWPKVAIIRVGNKSDDIYYENNIKKLCERLGIIVESILLSIDEYSKKLLLEVERINKDDSIHGCILLRPLPDAKIEQAVCKLLNPNKDIDGMTIASIAGVFSGDSIGYPPCTAQSCMEILDYYNIILESKKVVVLGRSMVIGKPISMMLQKKNATVTMCHSKTCNLQKECQEADVLVVAIGKIEKITREYVSTGQIIVDVGINMDENGNMKGDVNFNDVESIVSAISPVPGGVGSVTTAVLCKHIVDSAYKCFLKSAE